MVQALPVADNMVDVKKNLFENLHGFTILSAIERAYTTLRQNEWCYSDLIGSILVGTNSLKAGSDWT